MRVAVAADHNGVALKSRLVAWLEEHGHEVDDRGTHGDAVVDYPALCADVWTLRNLVQEIGRSYATYPQPAALPEVLMQYADFAAWQQDILADPEGEAGRAGPDDADLCSGHQPDSGSSPSITRRAIANAPFAAGTPQ